MFQCFVKVLFSLCEWTIFYVLIDHLFHDLNEQDDRSMADLQTALAQIQDELEKLNKSYIHLVDEHNVKQKHIDVSYLLNCI